MATMALTLNVNNQEYNVEVPSHRILLDVLREELGFTGTKESCREGECGVCTILLDGKIVNSCLMLAASARGKKITTVEGIADGQALHPVQSAFVDCHGSQCGFCTPGFIVAAKALIDENSDPSELEIREYLAGNLCRCTGYNGIVDAVQKAASQVRAGKS
jgi:carbon-monoxide dehydrogenase small subunit